MKKLLALLIIFVLFAGIAGCGTSNKNETSPSSGTAENKNDNAVVTIEFWNGHTGPDGEVMRQLAQKFEQQNPDVKINITSMAWDQLFTKADLAISQGSGPDLVTLPADRMPEISDKIIKPIDDLVKENFNVEDFDKSLWDLTIYNGKQYGIPLDTHPYVIYYNKDIFEKNNINVPNDRPLSKDEFLDIANKLSNVKEGKYGFVFKSLGVHAWWDTWPFFKQAGGVLWDPDGSNPQLNSEAMINAVSFLRSLQGVVAPNQLTDWQTAYSMFTTGNAAMIMHGSWLIPGLNKTEIKYGTIMVPQIFDNNYASFANMHMFAFTRLDDKKTEAALKFVKWFETEENELAWGKGSGNVPALTASRNEYAKDPILKPIALTADLNKNQLYMSPYVKEDATIIYKYIQPALEGIYKDKNVDIKSTLDKLNNDVKAVLGK